MHRAVVACVLAVIATSASAQTPSSSDQALSAGLMPRFELHDGHDLAAICGVAPTDPNYAESIGFCRGFGRGALAYYRAVTPVKTRRLLFCPPPNPPPEASVVSQFVTWAAANPTKLDEPAVNSVFRFLSETFPCAKK